MVEDGQTAVVHLVASTTDDGEPADVFETTDVDVAMAAGTYEAHRDYQPISFDVGAGEVPPAVEDAVREMEPGDERTVVADPGDAFGRRREDAVVVLDREIVEANSDTDAEVGSIVGDERGNAGWITDVDERTVTVDFNHEFAGEPVAFEVRLLDVRDASADSGSGDRG